MLLRLIVAIFECTCLAKFWSAGVLRKTVPESSAVRDHFTLGYLIGSTINYSRVVPIDENRNLLSENDAD